MSEQSVQLQLTGTLMLRCSPATQQTLHRELRRQIARYNPHAADQALQQLLTSADLGQVFLRDVFRLEGHERLVRGQVIRLDLFADAPQAQQPMSVLFLVDNAAWNKHLNGDGRVWAVVGILRNIGNQIVCLEVQRLLVLHTESNTQLVSRLANAVPLSCAFITEQEAQNRTLELNNDRLTWEQASKLLILDVSHWNQFYVDVQELWEVPFAQAHSLRYLYAHYQREKQRIQLIVFSPNTEYWQQAQQNLSVAPLDLYHLPKGRSLEIEWGRVQPRDLRTISDAAQFSMPRGKSEANAPVTSATWSMHLGDLTWLQEARTDYQEEVEVTATDSPWEQEFWGQSDAPTTARPQRNLQAWHLEVPREQWSAEIATVYAQISQEWQELHQMWSNPSATPQNLANYLNNTHRVVDNVRVAVAEELQLARHLAASVAAQNSAPANSAAPAPSVLERLRLCDTAPFHVIELGLSPAQMGELYNAQLEQERQDSSESEEKNLALERLHAQLERQLPRSGLLLARYFRDFARWATQCNNINLLKQTRSFAIPYLPSYLYNTSQVTNAVGKVGAYTPQLLSDNQNNADYASLLNLASYNSELGVVNFLPHTNQNLLVAELLSYIAARGQSVLYVARNTQQLDVLSNYLQHARDVLSVRLDSNDALPMRFYYRALGHAYNEQHVHRRVRCQQLQHEYRERIQGLESYSLNLDGALNNYRSQLQRQDNINTDISTAQQQLDQAQATYQRARINLDNLERLLRMLKLEKIRPEQWNQTLDFTVLAEVLLERVFNAQALGFNSRQFTAYNQQRLQDYVAGRTERNTQDAVNLLYDVMRCYSEELQPLLEQLQSQATEKAAVNYHEINAQLERNKEQRAQLLRDQEAQQQLEQQRQQLRARMAQATQEQEELTQRQAELLTQIHQLEQGQTCEDAELPNDPTSDAQESSNDCDLGQEFAGFGDFSEEFASQAQESADDSKARELQLEQLRHELTQVEQQLAQLNDPQIALASLEAQITRLKTSIAQVQEALMPPPAESKLRQQLCFTPSSLEVLNQGYSSIDAQNLDGAETFARKQYLLSSITNRVQDYLGQFQEQLQALQDRWQATDTAQRQELTQAQLQAQLCQENIEQLQQEQRNLERSVELARQELDRQVETCRQQLGSLPDEVLVREREAYPQASYFAPDVANLGNTVPLPPPAEGHPPVALTLEQYQQQVEVFAERFDNVSDVIHTLNGENNDELTYLQANTTFASFDQRWQEVLNFCGTRQQENVELVAEYRQRCNIILTSQDTSLAALQRNPHWSEVDVVVIEQAQDVEPLEVLPYLTRAPRVLLLGDAHQAVAHSLPLSVREELTQQFHALTQQQTAQATVAQRTIQVHDPDALFARLSQNWFAQLTQQVANYNYLGFTLTNQATITRGMTQLIQATYGDLVFNSTAQESTHQWLLRMQQGQNSELVWNGSCNFVWADTKQLFEREASWVGTSKREAQLVVQALRHLDTCLATAIPPINHANLQQRYEMAQIQRRVGVVVYNHAQALAIYAQISAQNFVPRHMQLEIVTVDQLPSMPYQYLIVSMTTAQVCELEGTERLTQVEIFNRIISRAQGMILWLAHSELLEELEFSLVQVDAETNRSHTALVPVYRNLIENCRSRTMGTYANAADLESYLRSNLGK